MAPNPTGPERRFLASAMRCEQRSDGTRYLVGHAANYNVLSSDLGGWKERIMPGAFTRAIRERQDVRHTINHNPNLVLGRTAAGTTTLREDSQGLAFRTVLPSTSYAKDLVESVTRGDVNECSFTFHAVRQAWLNEPDPEDRSRTLAVRELHDVNLIDVSTVTYPAYPGTNTDLRSQWNRMFPHGIPAEVRSALRGQKIERMKPNQSRYSREYVEELLDAIENDIQYQCAKDALNRL